MFLMVKTKLNRFGDAFERVAGLSVGEVLFSIVNGFEVTLI